MKNTKQNVLLLYKSSSWYNPLYVSVGNKVYEIYNILFYDKDTDDVVFSTGKGWFGSNSTFDVRLLTSKPIKRKTKLDFSKNEPFIIKSPCTYESRYDLYLPISDFDIKKKFKKIGEYIYASYSLTDDLDQECCWETVVKFLDTHKFALRGEIEEIGKRFSSWYSPMEQKEFNETIEKLQSLYKQYNDEVEYIKNYTVEDYLKELKEQEGKEEK